MKKSIGGVAAVGLGFVALAGGCGEILGLGDFEDAQETTATSSGAGGTGGGSTTTTTSSGGSATATSGTGGQGGATATTTGAGGLGGQGGQGGSICTPQDTMPCYGGPLGTEDIGLCMGGLATCDNQGMGYGPCVGEVLPAAETCTAPEDEDCDGQDCVVWAKVFGDSSYQSASGVGSDSQGNIVVGGFFYGAMTLGATSLSSAGSSDAFLAKLDAAGNQIWSKQFGDAATQATLMMAVDVSDNIVIAGIFAGTINMGGGTLTSAGLDDIFVAKFDANGNHIWSKRFGNTSSNSPNALSVGPAGEVLLAGGFAGAIDFGSGTMTSAGSSDIFVVKLLGTNGATAWAKVIGDAAAQSAKGVACDAQGNVVVAGDFGGTINFGNGNLTAVGGQDVFVARFDPSGGLSWSKNFVGSNAESAASVAVDPLTSEIVVTGGFDGSINVGGASFAQPSNVFLVKLSAGGNHVWSKSFGIGSAGPQLDIDASGRLLLAGTAYSAIDFGGGPLVPPGMQTGAYVAKLDGTGNHLWSRRFDATVGILPGGVAAAPSGEAILVCAPDGIVDFGSGPLATAGGYDIAIVTLAP